MVQAVGLAALYAQHRISLGLWLMKSSNFLTAPGQRRPEHDTPTLAECCDGK
jgi:hypothetical protein